MKIYTSYYKKFSMCPSAMIPVRISNGVPIWFTEHLEEMPEVYPGWDLVRNYRDGLIDWTRYTEVYLEKLNKVGRDAILERLREISKERQDRDICLLCFEKDGNCHRHILAEFLDCDIEEF